MSITILLCSLCASYGMLWVTMILFSDQIHIHCITIHLTHTTDFTYLLTPWSTVLLEKLMGSQLVKKFPAFYGIQRCINKVTRASHLTLSQARSVQSTSRIPLPEGLSYYYYYYPPIYASVIQVVSFSRVSQPKPCMHLSFLHTCYLPCPSHSSQFYHTNNNWEWVRF